MKTGEAERIQAALHALKPFLDGTTIEVSGELNRPPMPFNEMMRATFEKARKIAAGIGMDLKASGTGGASDANFIALWASRYWTDWVQSATVGTPNGSSSLRTACPSGLNFLATVLREW